jgi:hypothetical protein
MQPRHGLFFVLVPPLLLPVQDAVVVVRLAILGRGVGGHDDLRPFSDSVTGSLNTTFPVQCLAINRVEHADLVQVDRLLETRAAGHCRCRFRNRGIVGRVTMSGKPYSVPLVL